MLFNSLDFVAFLLLFLACYFGCSKHLKTQNGLLLVASYFFYGYWDWRFLSLIAVSTLVDFVIGRALGRSETAEAGGQRRRTLLLATSVVVNLTILAFFKYFNFFAEGFGDLLNLAGIQADPITLNIILPVGISFYTFQTMSYTIDIYRNRLKATDSLLDFAVFVSFFPQLVAGPIERAAHLLPQVERPRRVRLEQVNTGLFLVLWGYFKKVVVADNAALISDRIFNGYTDYTGLDILIGVLAFSVQIYGDFSGYSDIARGLSRLMGFELMVNFRLPYFALNPSDFWQRWHISLSSWLRDYLYIPLGGNKVGGLKTYRNLSLTMLLGGLWHGAAWNFVLWGAFHGLILILYRVFERRPVHQDPWGGEHRYAIVIGKMGLMFALTLFGWLLFRATSVHQIGYMLSHVSLFPSVASWTILGELLFFSLPLILMQVWQYLSRDLLVLTKTRIWVKVPAYSFMLVCIFIFGVRESMEFIYFQF